MRKAKFWHMPYADIVEAQAVYERTVSQIKTGKIVKEIKGKRRLTFFPSKSSSRVAHVRPHARNSAATYRLPVQDQVTGLREYTKHSFWLNADYVRTRISIRNNRF